MKMENAVNKAMTKTKKLKWVKTGVYEYTADDYKIERWSMGWRIFKGSEYVGLGCTMNEAKDIANSDADGIKPVAYIAEMWSGKYEFKACGKTEDDAKNVLLKYWIKEGFGDYYDTVEKIDEYYGIRTYAVIIGNAEYE
jgi:hypothetical protein